jgi:hypothetical protein
MQLGGGLAVNGGLPFRAIIVISAAGLANAQPNFFGNANGQQPRKSARAVQ